MHVHLNVIFVMQFISWYGNYIFPACGINIFKLYYIGKDRYV